MSKYKHFCPDWDGMEIDETDPEFACCLCFEKEKKKQVWEYFVLTSREEE